MTYRLFIRVWVKQDKVFNSPGEAAEAGKKIAKPEDMRIEEENE